MLALVFIHFRQWGGVARGLQGVVAVRDVLGDALDAHGALLCIAFHDAAVREQPAPLATEVAHTKLPAKLLHLATVYLLHLRGHLATLLRVAQAGPVAQAALRRLFIHTKAPEKLALKAQPVAGHMPLPQPAAQGLQQLQQLAFACCRGGRIWRKEGQGGKGHEDETTTKSP